MQPTPRPELPDYLIAILVAAVLMFGIPRVAPGLHQALGDMTSAGAAGVLGVLAMQISVRLRQRKRTDA